MLYNGSEPIMSTPHSKSMHVVTFIHVTCLISTYYVYKRHIATVSVHYCSSNVTYIWFVVCFRCRIWVENCRRADLEAKTSDQLNKHYRLCAKHFDPAMVCKTVSITHNCSQQPGSMFSLISKKWLIYSLLLFRAPTGLY